MNMAMRTVWVVWVNSDLTEGKGWRVPIAVCELRSTAERLAKRADVQGSNGTVVRQQVEDYGSHVMAPVQLTKPDRGDEAAQRELDARLAAEEARERAIAEAERLGLAEEFVRALRGPQP